MKEAKKHVDQVRPLHRGHTIMSSAHLLAGHPIPSSLGASLPVYRPVALAMYSLLSGAPHATSSSVFYRLLPCLLISGNRA